MLDTFRPLPVEARRVNRVAYSRTFWPDRGGVVDVEKRTLTRREEGMARFNRPLSRVREMDRGLFDAQYTSFDPRVPTSPEMLLLIALVKVNAAEAFGVNQAYEKVFRRAVKNNDALELTLLIEETYHTRILLSSAVLYGIAEVTAPFKLSGDPARHHRWNHSAGSQVHVTPLTLAAEILGTLGFLNLLEKTRELLGHDPELRDSIEEPAGSAEDHADRRDRPHQLQPDVSLEAASASLRGTRPPAARRHGPLDGGARARSARRHGDGLREARSPLATGYEACPSMCERAPSCPDLRRGARSPLDAPPRCAC